MSARKNQTQSIGAFGEREAQIIASTLKLTAGIGASVERLLVDSGPTDWWHVYVRASDLKLAQVWLKGWSTGRTILAIETNPNNACLWPEFAAFFPEVRS